MTIRRPARARQCTATSPSNSSKLCPGTCQAARLVGHGFRLWLSGYKTGDVSRWEEAWQLYSNVLGPRAAQVATGELSCWVRAVSASATREIKVYPAQVPGFAGMNA